MKNILDNLILDGGYTAILRSIGCIGDSLSSGEHEFTKPDGTKGYYDLYEHSWGQYLARKCGVKVQNFSCGGLTALGFNQYQAYNKSFNVDKLCYSYVLALGVNDLNPPFFERDYKEYGFGSIDDIDFEDYNKNKPSFVGYYVRIIQKIKEVQPDARIFLMTIPRDKVDGENRPLRDKHAELLRQLPSLFKNTYVLDLRKENLIFDETFRKKYFLGGHMNAMGYKLIGDIVATMISNVIEENYKDFSDFALIGTGLINKNSDRY